MRLHLHVQLQLRGHSRVRCIVLHYICIEGLCVVMSFVVVVVLLFCFVVCLCGAV